MILFETLAGSRLYGTNTPESDIDQRGVCLEPVNSLVGLQSPFEQKELPPDTVIYGLRKFLRLALAGNPNILDTLFAPPEFWIVSTPAWNEIYALRHAFLSQRVRKTYVGYAMAQLSLLQRQEVPKKKHAAHLLRLMIQCVSILLYEDYSPVLDKDTQLGMIRSVLDGEMSIDTVIEMADQMKVSINAMHSNLPDEPDPSEVEKLMVKIYQDWIGTSTGVNGMIIRPAFIADRTIAAPVEGVKPSLCI
jgi:uncharacterized protein